MIMRAIVLAAVLAMSGTALAKPPTTQERIAEQRERREAHRERQAEERAERKRVTQAKRSANDLGLEGSARRRYVDLHRSGRR